jgi:hypothetical protein
LKNNQLKLKEMKIRLNYLNKIIKYLLIDADSIKYPIDMRSTLGIDNAILRFHETLAIYLYQKYGREGIINLTNEQKEEAIRASGIITVPNSYNFISLEKEFIDNNFFNVEATIIFRNDNRNFLFHNCDYKIYTIENNEWIYSKNNFIQIESQYNTLYKLIDNATNKASYVIFVNTSYTSDNINIEDFVREKVNYSLELLRNMLGSHGVNKLGMSFTFMNNYEDDMIALPVMINTVQGFLSGNNYINSVIMNDFGNSFNNYYRTNYQFILD